MLAGSSTVVPCTVPLFGDQTSRALNCHVRVTDDSPDDSLQQYLDTLGIGQPQFVDFLVVKYEGSEPLSPSFFSSVKWVSPSVA